MCSATEYTECGQFFRKQDFHTDYCECHQAGKVSVGTRMDIFVVLQPASVLMVQQLDCID